MAAPDYEFYEGFDKYGPTGTDLGDTRNTSLWADEWNSVGGGDTRKIVGALTGVIANHGAIRMKASNSGNSPAFLQKALPANYARVVGGFTFQALDTFSKFGIQFLDLGTSVVQCTLGINLGTGKIEIYRDYFGTLLGATTEVVSLNTIHTIEYDITIHNTLGKCKIWLDGVPTSIDLINQNMRVSANNYLNCIRPQTINANNHSASFDHMYFWFYTASGGVETPALTNPVIETSIVNADDAVAFTIAGHAFMSPQFYWGTNVTTNTPGANTMHMKKCIPDQAGAISNVVAFPNTTAPLAKFKAVIYADAAGSPTGAPLATGTEVVGSVSGAQLILPVALAGVVAGTPLWIGFIMDTSINFGANDDAGISYQKANTYTAGPPNPVGAGFTTNANNINLIVTMTGVANHYAQANAFPPLLGDLSYNFSNTVGQQELFTFPALQSNPISAIYGAAIKARISRSDTGVRSAKFLAKSAGVTGYGYNVNITPPANYGMEASYFRNDPNTGAVWATAAALNAAKWGVEVTV